MKRSHLALLGDFHIGVEAPLEMTFLPDSDKPNHFDGKGSVEFTVGSVTFSAGGKLLHDERSKRLALFLMSYGGWHAEYESFIEDDQLAWSKWTANPPEANTSQDFEVVGSLASMYARLFESETRNDLGPVSLDLPTEPGMLPALIPHDFQGGDLALWRLVLEPSPSTPSQKNGSRDARDEGERE